tara:strand:+ start:114 stop:314 length:201 start_codon:yes stop_codon:yes gene_type:complete
MLIAVTCPVYTQYQIALHIQQADFVEGVDHRSSGKSCKVLASFNRAIVNSEARFDEPCHEGKNTEL